MALLFSFGVITDIQYANIPDGFSFHGTPRFYRHSLQALRAAVSSWQSQGGISFVLQLGDLVDGKCPRVESAAALAAVVAEFAPFRSYHVLGNHCLYNLPRSHLNRVLAIPSLESGSSYYDFLPHPGFRFVILDSYDVSALGWPRDDARALAAIRRLGSKNPNGDKNSPLGLAIEDQRFVEYNGGIGEAQLQWLDETLRAAMERRERVVIVSHIPILLEASFPDTLVWNAEEVLGVIHRYGRCVVACLAGHKHEGGQGVDSHGVFHGVLEAVLECPPGENSFGRVDVYEDRLVLRGSGRMSSAEVLF